MQNIKIVNNIDFVYSLKPLKHGEGGFAKCYFYDSDNIIKVYFDLVSSSCIALDDMEETLGFKNSTYIFPHTVYKNKDNQLLSTVQNYISGTNLDCLKRKVNIDDFFNSIDKVVEDTKIVADNAIVTSDIAASNMIYKPGKITVIDSDFFSVQRYISPNKILKIDMENVIDALLQYFTQNYNVFEDGYIQDFIKRNDHTYNLYSSLSSHMDDYKLLKEFILCMVDTVERETKTEFQTIDQMQKAILRSRNI